MFQTALPFGYLLQGVVLLGVTIGGFALLGRSLLRRERQSAALGAGLLLVVGTCVGIAASLESVDQWNPRPDRDALLGRWEDAGMHLELLPDSTFRLDASDRFVRQTGFSAPAGTWTLDDFNLDLRASEGNSIVDLRVVVSSGVYRIIVQPDEPDVWDGRLGFARTPPSAAPECRACE